MPQEAYKQDRKLCRSDDGLLGGVCAGLAARFDLDVALVRIVAVLAGVFSGGLFVIVYLIAWAVLPKSCPMQAPFDVSPDAFRSEVYSRVVAGDRMGSQASWQASAPVQPADPAPFSSASSRDKRAGVALSAGLVCIATGAAVLLSLLTGTFSIWHFWPLLVVALGVVRLVFPGKGGERTFSTMVGVSVLFVGVVLLFVQLDVLDVSLRRWLVEGGPFLVVALGFYVVGLATQSRPFFGVAAAAVCVFCLVGVIYCIDMDYLAVRNYLGGLDLPFGLGALPGPWS